MIIHPAATHNSSSPQGPSVNKNYLSTIYFSSTISFVSGVMRCCQQAIARQIETSWLSKRSSRIIGLHMIYNKYNFVNVVSLANCFDRLYLIFTLKRLQFLRGKFHPEILRGPPRARASYEGVGKTSHFLALNVNLQNGSRYDQSYH